MDDSGIDEVVRRFVESWNRRDWTAFGSCFSARSDYVTGEADHWSGRETISRKMNELMLAGGTGGTAVIAGRTIRRLGSDVALVHLAWRLVEGEPTTASPALARSGMTILVVALHDHTWLIEAAQNTDAPSSPLNLA